MKRKLIKAGILTVIFIAALGISSLVINRDVNDEMVDMGAPTLPRISFSYQGQEINPLFGYVREMDLTAMRDTITPLNADGTLEMNVEAFGNEIRAVRYRVCSLDGEQVYEEGSAELASGGDGGNASGGGSVTLSLGDALPGTEGEPSGGQAAEPGEEAVLEVTLETEENTANYYTRVIRSDELSTDTCLAFVGNFHANALSASGTEEMELYLEPGEESDNTTYQTVNIHSDITHIQWGDLHPEVTGEVEWSIKESNTVYTSLLAKYQVSCQDENGNVQTYNIKEFFRVRDLEGTIYLLDYNRDMEEVFEGTSASVSRDGIILGIASDEVQYESDKEGTLAAFVQERELWLYDGTEDAFTKVFSFADQEGRDIRSMNDQHAVRIISMGDGGSLAFAVYGYMNRGPHEGQVGVGIYYYAAGDSAVEEKAFIPSTKSFAIAEEELGKMVYYNHDRSMLYVLADGTLYQIDLDRDEQQILAEGLGEDEYAVSDDGHLMAYQTAAGQDEDDRKSGDAEKGAESGGENGGNDIRVMDLRSGEGYEIPAAEGEELRPLGFVNGDFIYGMARGEDAGTTISGEEVSPMYEVEIRNSKNEAEAAYTFADQNIYITDILIDGNLVTLNRVQKNGDQYAAAAREYVTNNRERTESKVTLEAFSTEVKETEQALIFADGLDTGEPTVAKPALSVAKKPLTITLGEENEREVFYVYGMGELAGVYDRAGDAVQKAELVSGVVISSDQTYVWEKGNRDLVYSTEAEAFRREGEETSLQACERYMEQYGSHRIDLTGCTLEQVLYVINRGCPLIALTDTDHAILLTGYTLTDITYIDPDSGAEHTVGMGEMERMAESGGNTFIGYIR